MTALLDNRAALVSHRADTGRKPQFWALRLMRDAFVDEFDDVLRGRAGKENFGDARFLQRRDVCFGDDPAEYHRHVVHAFVVQ